MKEFTLIEQFFKPVENDTLTHLDEKDLSKKMHVNIPMKTSLKNIFKTILFMNGLTATKVVEYGIKNYILEAKNKNLELEKLGKRKRKLLVKEECVFTIGVSKKLFFEFGKHRPDTLISRNSIIHDMIYHYVAHFKNMSVDSE